MTSVQYIGATTLIHVVFDLYLLCNLCTIGSLQLLWNLLPIHVSRLYLHNSELEIFGYISKCNRINNAVNDSVLHVPLLKTTNTSERYSMMKYMLLIKA